MNSTSQLAQGTQKGIQASSSITFHFLSFDFCISCTKRFHIECRPGSGQLGRQAVLFTAIYLLGRS